MNCDPYGSRELYLESIMDLQTELVCRFLPDCTLTYVNDAYSKAFGIPKDQLIGRKFTEFIPESEHEAVLTSIQSLDAQKTKQTYTHKVIIPGEAKAWQQWTDIAILDDQKRVIEIQSTGRNITEQILAEQQRDLQTSLQKLIFSISVTYINIPLDELDKNIGQSLNEIGEFCSADRVYIFEYNFHDNYVSNTNEWCRNGINSQINNLQQVPLDDLGEWVSSHSAGNTLQIDDVNELPEASFNRKLLEPQGIKSLLTVPLMDAETCLGFVGLDYVETKRTFGTFEEQLLRLFAQLLVNIRNRKTTQNLLLEREYFLSDLVNKSASVIMVKNKSGEYQLVNEMWETVFGFTQDQISGKKDTDVFPAHISKQLGKSHLSVVDSGRTQEHEIVLESTGKIVYYLCTSFPINDARGNLTGVCTIGIDITDRKNAIEERLIRGKFEAISQAKSTFLKNLSMEVRPPLNSVIGITQSLKESGEPVEPAQLKILQRNTRLLMSIFNNITDYSKHESGSLTLLMNNFSIRVLATDLQDIFGEKADRKGISFRLVLDDNAPLLFKSDESRLRQILNSLISHIISFTKEGYVELRMSAKRNQRRLLSPQTYSDYYLRFDFNNTGSVTSNQLLQNFLTTKPNPLNDIEFAQFGLSLTITKTLIDLMGGTVTIDKKQNPPKSITLFVPVSKPE